MDINQFIKDNSLKIYVKPNSKQNKIITFDEDKNALRVDIKAPAQDNKANIEIIKFFSRELKRKTIIKKGIKSKEKLLIFS